MRRAIVIQAGALFLLFSLSGHAVAVGQDAAVKPRATLGAWDTDRPSAEPLAPAVVADPSGWKPISSQQKTAVFQGDAVVTNGRVLAVVRQRAPAVEVYSVGASRPTAQLRLRLLTASGELAERLERVALVEQTRAALCLEASYKTAKGTAVTARFRLKRGDVCMQVEPGEGAGRLRVECPARFVVLPDFFADDILIDAHAIPPDTAELPSENFLLHLARNGDSIALCVFENRQQDVKVALTGVAEQRLVTSSEIAFEAKKVWVAVLDSPQIWHTRELKAADAGKIVALDWKMPFAAQWRFDFTQSNGLADSWEMLLPEKNGGYVKPSWLGGEAEHLGANRLRWNTVLGRYPYPSWADLHGRGYLQPIRHSALKFQGPVVVYPVNRVQQTPLDMYTVVDVMRNTLGVGPCEYILDLEGQKAEYKGRATCSVRDELGAIYDAGQQKQRRAAVEKFLNEGLTFVTHIRSRITRYVEFGHKTRAYLAAQKIAHPELVDFLTEMDEIASQIDARVAARADKIQTPAHVAAMNEDFRKNVLNDVGSDAAAKCRKYTTALVVIGDNQDELSGECRWVVKALRQRAGLRLALDPRAATVAAEIRARTQEALRNPASHEGAHH
jgi:hypothetical protein